MTIVESSRRQGKTASARLYNRIMGDRPLVDRSLCDRCDRPLADVAGCDWTGCGAQALIIDAARQRPAPVCGQLSVKDDRSDLKCGTCFGLLTDWPNCRLEYCPCKQFGGPHGH